MKKLLFGVAGFVAIVVACLFGDYAIVTPYCTVYAGLLTFGAIIGAMYSVYAMEVDVSKDIIETQNKDLDELKRIISIKDFAFDQLQGYANEDKKTIDRQCGEINSVIQDKNKLKRDYQGLYELCSNISHEKSLLLMFINDPDYITFAAAYFNNGDKMSQNALADKLGMSRAKVRRTADEINKLLVFEYIKWGDAKVRIANVKSSDKVIGMSCAATVLDENDDSSLLKEMTSKKPYELGFDEFEGLRIPKNWMKQFDQVRIAALKNIDTCGHNSGFTESMNCSGIYCNQCICLYPNNSVARRLIAKVENEMGK